MRILIVDDDYVSRSQLKALFAKYGDCDAAPNGAIALALFEAAHREQAPYDIISLDLDMPDIDGHTVVLRIRGYEEDEKVDFTVDGHKARILMVSGLKDKSSIMESFRVGSEGYLIKPVTPDKIAEAFRKFELA